MRSALVLAAAMTMTVAPAVHAKDFNTRWSDNIQALGVDLSGAQPSPPPAAASASTGEDEFVRCRKQLEGLPDAAPSSDHQKPRWRKAALPALDVSDPSSLQQAAERTAAYWRRRKGATISIDRRRVGAPALAAALDELAALARSGVDGAALQTELAARFDAYEALSDAGTPGKVTGYCAPEIPIVPRAERGKAVPLYAMPAREADRHVSNAQILDGALDGRARQLYGVPNPMNLSSLQTEGSGWGRLPDGSKVFLKYAGSNGYKWRGVSGALFQCGITSTKLDGKRLMDFAHSLPFAQQAEMSVLNPSYVFFQALPSGDPEGGSGIALTGGRSIAIDPDRVPYGLPGILVRLDEKGHRIDGRVVVAQDKGGAIKGGGRVDLYFGAGDAAEQQADVQNAPGRLYVLVPRAPASPSAAK